MEISDCGGYRLEPGVVDVRFIQRRRPVGGGAEVGGNVDRKVIELADKIESTAPQIYPVVELRKLSVWLRMLEVTAHVELHQPANRKRQPAIRRGDGRSPFGHTDLGSC